MRSFIYVLLTSCFFAAGVTAQQPQTMTKIVVQLQSAGVPQDSFAAKPKTMYRAGTKFCRVEEEADIEHGIHGLLIVHEPDAWMVNRLDHTARHLVDPGPTLNCRLPILAAEVQGLPEDEAKPIAELEFGAELAYFDAKKATPQSGPILQNQPTMMRQLHFGESTVVLFTIGTSTRPLAVAWTRGDHHDIFWYSGYGEVAFDKTLFDKPSGVKVEEMKQ
jgi:hypothetical protein